MRLLTAQVCAQAAMLHFERDALMDAGGAELSEPEVLSGETGWGGTELPDRPASNAGVASKKRPREDDGNKQMESLE